MPGRVPDNIEGRIVSAEGPSLSVFARFPPAEETTEPPTISPDLTIYSAVNSRVESRVSVEESRYWIDNLIAILVPIYRADVSSQRAAFEEIE